MNKILNYIHSGKGIGALFLLALSLICVLFISLSLSLGTKEIVEKTQEVSEKLLPIKIENYTLVEPATEKREASFSIGGQQINFAIDPTTDALDTSALKQGIYMSRKNVYFVSDVDTKVESFAQNLDLPKGDYRDTITELLSMLKWTIILVSFIGFFIAFVVLALFYAFCAGIIGSILKKAIPFDAKMRLSSICLSGVVILFILLSFVGLNLGLLASLPIVLLLQFFYFAKIVPTAQD